MSTVPQTDSVDLSAKHTRRVILRASAILAAWSSSHGPVFSHHTSAQSYPETLAVDIDANAIVAASTSTGFNEIATEFPISAAGASWDSEVGTWPVIEVQLSLDGDLYTDSFFLLYDTDTGKETIDDRLHSRLVHSGGANFLRFRSLDPEGNLAFVDGLVLTFVNTFAGPTRFDTPTAFVATDDPSAPPPIVGRAEWGADDAFRFNDGEEIYPPIYASVEHAIVHHTQTQNLQDPVQAMRSIYYYHAVTRGWGDIGYNYLVDRFGTIYEGRYGGQGVAGSHAWLFNLGSAGISLLGDFRFQDMTVDAKAALVAIVAWSVRELDPLGESDFYGVANLPTIAGHRDLNPTDCPGDVAYDDLQEVRQLVADVLSEIPTGPPAGLVVGDFVVVVTDDGGPLNVRDVPGLDGSVITQLLDGTLAIVVDGPEFASEGSWYAVSSGAELGWVTAAFLELAPPEVDEKVKFTVGDLVAVNVDSVDLRLRPDLSAEVINVAPRDLRLLAMVGPKLGDGLIWFNFADAADVDAGVFGWSEQESFRLISAGPPLPRPPRFDFGDSVLVTSALNLRSSASTSGTVITTMATGTIGTVIDGPTTANGYEWWQITVPAGTGWAASINLVKTTAPPPPPPPPTPDTFDIGDTVRVTSSLRLRTTPSTTGSILTTMTTDTIATVIGGPVNANSYEWWQVSGPAGTGWAASIGLVETTAPPPPPPPAGGTFDIGDTVRVISSLRLRSAPSTSGTIITTMASGTVGTVLAGPTNANGYEWWQIQVANGTGWAAGEFLAETTAPPLPPDSAIDIGDQIVTTSSLRLRSSPSLSATVITTMPTGTSGAVQAGPQSANGYTWWQIATAANTGWAAGEFLAPA